MGFAILSHKAALCEACARTIMAPCEETAKMWKIMVISPEATL
jgi:hypothetical protein